VSIFKLAVVALVAMAPIEAGAVSLGSIEKAHEAYNKAAEKGGFKSRMVLRECSSDKARVCTISLTGQLGAVAASDTADLSKASDLTIMLAKNSDPVYFTEAVVVSILAWSPSASKEERGQAFRELLRGLKEGRKTQVILDGATYKLMPQGVAGIWFSVE
jgi:hypothetical protein